MANKKHKCCMAGCKFKHEALIVVLSHMAKEHKLTINGRPIYIRSCDAVYTEGEKDGK